MKIPYSEPSSIGQVAISLPVEIAAAILATIMEGWQHALTTPEVYSGAHEVPMTERLRDGMQACIKTRKYPWCEQIAVLPGTESRSPGVLVPDGVTDIAVFVVPIFQARGEQNPHAIIECKRIAGTDGTLCRHYVTQGIDRFGSGKYAAEHSVGFMVGYVIDGTSTAAAAGVNGCLAKAKRAAERLTSQSDGHWHSEHPRPKQSIPINLSHALLMTTRSAPRQRSSLA